MEIDEYQNYEKAVGALTEAFKCLSKSKVEDNEEKENKLTSLKTKNGSILKCHSNKNQFSFKCFSLITTCIF